MPRLKLKRFKAKPPAPDVLAEYLRVYHAADLYFSPETLPPISAQELFGCDVPLIFDLGSGRGDFLIGQAAEHPDRYYVGIELHWKSLYDSINKAHAAGLHNVRFVKADLRLGLVKVPDEAATDVYLLFPPPRLEGRELKSDLLSERILHQIHRLLIPGGHFHFVTDHPAYFERKLALIAESGLFTDLRTSRLFEGGITWFQKLWESSQIESLRLECKKKRFTTEE